MGEEENYILTYQANFTGEEHTHREFGKFISPSPKPPQNLIDREIHKITNRLENLSVSVDFKGFKITGVYPV